MENWSQVSEYGWVHSSGWAIALMYVRGEPGYMLSRESAVYGPFASLWDAQAHHAILVPAFSAAERDETEAAEAALCE